MKPSSDWFAALIKEENCAFLCGAGISVPSGLPSAASYVKHLVDVLASRLPADIELDGAVYQSLCGHRMEFIFQVATQTPGISVEQAMATLEGAQPNLMHLTIMQLASHYGTRPGVVLTTNFECLLEDAGAAIGLPPLSTQPTKSGLPITFNELVSVYKLHGSTQHGDALEEQMIKATLDRFGKYFTEEDETVLDSALRGRTLIVLGYSGNDHYDITPYLLRRPYKRLVWIQFDPTVPEGEVEENKSIPESIQQFFENGDLYLCGNTLAILSEALRDLGITINRDAATCGADWRTKVDDWVSSLGARATIFMADLLLRQNEWNLAIALYQQVVSLPAAEKDLYLRVKARRNIGTALTLSGDARRAEGFILETLLDLDGYFAPNSHPKLTTDDIAQLVKRMETRDEVSVNFAAELLMELGLSHNGLAAYEPAYINTSLYLMTLAHELAARCRAYPLLGKIQSNFGRIYHQMGVNRDMDQMNSIEKATPYFMDAFELFRIENNFESLIGTAQKLGPCLIAMHEYSAALGIYQQAAWYARAFAYTNNAWDLRFFLGLAAATAGFLVFIRKESAAAIEGVLDFKRLHSINAYTLVTQCAGKAFAYHTQGRGSQIKNTIDLANFIHEQGHAFASNEMAGWGFN